jgi:5-methylcytosine-specific restriction endonuclease McrBC GTP-binding regulatory subunit McrB
MELITPLWRGQLTDVYYYVAFNGYCISIEKAVDQRLIVDGGRWKSGNYFQTYEEARPYAKKMALAFTNIFNTRTNVNM